MRSFKVEQIVRQLLILLRGATQRDELLREVLKWLKALRDEYRQERNRSRRVRRQLQEQVAEESSRADRAERGEAKARQELAEARARADRAEERYAIVDEERAESENLILSLREDLKLEQYRERRLVPIEHFCPKCDLPLRFWDKRQQRYRCRDCD